MRRTILLLTLALLTGCGSKGALYLPAEEEEAAPAPSPAPSPSPSPSPSIDEGIKLDTGDENLEPGAGDKSYDEEDEEQ
jgi:predicted small lipoprotein YifL